MIKILKGPLGLINIDFDPNAPKQTYLLQGFVEFETFIDPERTQFLGNNTQSKRMQYGLKYHVTSTIHAAMVDTLQITAS